MAAAAFITLNLLNLLCGYAVLRLLRIRLPFLQLLSCSLLTGLGLSSLIPMFMEGLHIRFGRPVLWLVHGIFSLLPVVFLFWQKEDCQTDFKITWPKIKLYEWASLILIFYLLGAGAYKCFYYPPTPRDLITGAEGLAEFTWKEHSIRNSFLLQDLSTTNNHQKPPSVLGLQIIYKLLVQDFGQVWLISMSFSFFIFLYGSLRRITHPLFAGLLTICCIAVPELYAYTIMALFDFPNMVFVFMALYFYREFSQTTELKYLVVCSVNLAIAVFFRVETLILAGMISAVFAVQYYLRHRWKRPVQFIKQASVLFLPSLLIYLVAMEWFLKKVLAIPFQASDSINPDPGNLQPLLTRFSDLFTKLMFNYKPAAGEYSADGLYNHTFLLFAFFFLGEMGFLVIKKKLNREAGYWFIATFLLIFFIAFFGYLLPLADLLHTSKRALFKVIPVGFMAVASSSVLRLLSDYICKWEQAPGFFIKPTKQSPN